MEGNAPVYWTGHCTLYQGSFFPDAPVYRTKEYLEFHVIF